MKELFRESFDSSKIEIIQEQQQKKEIKLIDQQRKISGLTLWEFNTKTKVISVAKFKKTDVLMSQELLSPKSKVRFTVTFNDECVYLQALNIKNAQRKLIKMGYHI